MGKETKIAWCDHTFNPWIGCKKVSPGCDHCYAERQNAFYKWVPFWGNAYHRTSENNWKEPIKWAKEAVKDGVIRTVFCASLADVLDTNVSYTWQFDLWDLITETAEIGGLEWLLLTKRSNSMDMIPPHLNNPVSSVRMGVTAENQEMADIRIRDLLNNWHGKNFVSIEPMLGPINLEPYLQGEPFTKNYKMNFGLSEFEGVNWVIVGGETGKGFRPMELNWANDLVTQCKEYETPVFVKQLGGWPDVRKDPAGWPLSLQVQEFPYDGK